MEVINVRKLIRKRLTRMPYARLHDSSSRMCLLLDEYILSEYGLDRQFLNNVPATNEDGYFALFHGALRQNQFMYNNSTLEGIPTGHYMRSRLQQ